MTSLKWMILKNYKVSTMENKMENTRTISTKKMIKKTNTILVACSGGPDSMFLLKTLNNKKNKKETIIVCHVNYKLRESAERDQKIVEKFCSDNHLKLEILTISDSFNSQYAKIKNFQSKARQMRYDFFARVGKMYGSNLIYVAHHKDDFIETAIMQENRSDEYLFYGLKKENVFKGMVIIRPLLNIYKSEILEELKRERIMYGIDESNANPKYERNLIRSKLDRVSIKEKDKIYKLYSKLNRKREVLNKTVDKFYNR